MPHPSQIDREMVIATARQLIERDGLEKLSLRKLADELGVKAPSLYRYFKNKTAILRAVNEDTSVQLTQALRDAVDHDVPLQEQLISLAHTYRAFAHENRLTYGLLMTNTIEDIQPPDEVLAQNVLPLQALFAQWVGENDSLPALRGAFALLHGWSMLENANQLRRGGDLDAHFEASFRAYIAGWRQ